MALQRPLKWDAAQGRAFLLWFAGRMPLDKIALDCAISPRTLDYWIAHPDWQERTKAARAALVDELTAMGVSYVAKEQRLIALSQMAESARVQYEAAPVKADGSFNVQAFTAFRESLDDMARELGERRAGAMVAVSQQQAVLSIEEKRAQLRKKLENTFGSTQNGAD